MIYLPQHTTFTPKYESILHQQAIGEDRPGTILADGYNDYEKLANLYHRHGNYLFLGRGLNYPCWPITRQCGAARM